MVVDKIDDEVINERRVKVKNEKIEYEANKRRTKAKNDKTSI